MLRELKGATLAADHPRVGGLQAEQAICGHQPWLRQIDLRTACRWAEQDERSIMSINTIQTNYWIK
ncbi:hypothetical protein ACYJW8_11200 [Frateuria aurantia]